MRNLRASRRSMGAVWVAVAVMSATTACLPTPADIADFGCGRSFGVNDYEGVQAYIESLYPGYAAGIASPPEVIYSNLQALSSANSSALGSFMAGVWVDTDLTSAVIGVTGNLANMTTVINAIAPYPAEVIIEDRSSDAAIGAAIWQDIVAAGIDVDAAYGTRLIGFLRNGLVVNLPATAAGAALATDIRAEHGNRVSISVGTRRLAGGPEFDAGACLIAEPRWVIGSGIPDNVVVSTIVDDPTVSPGGTVTGRIEVTYNGAGEAYVYPAGDAYCLPTNQPLTTTDRQFTVNGSTIGAYPDVQGIFDIGERWPLRYGDGGAAAPWTIPNESNPDPSGYCADPDAFGPIATGQTKSVAFTADTQSSRPEDGILLPPGRYFVRPMVWIQTVNAYPESPTALPPTEIQIVAPAG